MDVFGVSPDSIAEIERCFGDAARVYAFATSAGDPQLARELEEKLEKRIKEAGGFETVEITVVHSFEPNAPAHLTFNITLASKKPAVEYLPEPKDEVQDPDGLLASWKEYEKLGKMLDFAGEIPDFPACPVHHCLFGFDHLKLRAFGEKFSRLVPVDRDALIKVLQTDKDEKDRAAAAYLLAHLHGAQDVLSALLPRLRDPDARVRNSILRVVAIMAEHGEANTVDIEPILPFLVSQSLTDRNKAVSIVAALAGNRSRRKLLMQRSGCDLVRLLETEQPNQSLYAHEALVKLHDTDLGAKSPALWRRWLKSQGVVCQAEPRIGEGKLCPVQRRREKGPSSSVDSPLSSGRQSGSLLPGE
ncbi:MAG TPA: HEAT repeat domain-containing protein [Thermoanaerobaculia bacterium]|jgi:hypothetical protein|nr:HEAT repeat domain-containing protein [Thermoanaerobaculia bacterium]